MKTLSKQQIFLLHRQLIESTGGSAELRDEGLLESAIAAPFQAFDDFTAYPTVQQKAARLGFGLSKYHPFVDGNKRIGAHAMLVLLALNGISLRYTQEELTAVILRVASGSAGYDDLLLWVIAHQI